MGKAKPFDISKQVVVEAYKRVKANKGAAGVDGEPSTLANSLQSVQAYRNRGILAILFNSQNWGLLMGVQSYLQWPK